MEAHLDASSITFTTNLYSIKATDYAGLVFTTTAPQLFFGIVHIQWLQTQQKGPWNMLLSRILPQLLSSYTKSVLHLELGQTSKL